MTAKTTRADTYIKFKRQRRIVDGIKGAIRYVAEDEEANGNPPMEPAEGLIALAHVAAALCCAHTTRDSAMSDAGVTYELIKQAIDDYYA